MATTGRPQRAVAPATRVRVVLTATPTGAAAATATPSTAAVPLLIVQPSGDEEISIADPLPVNGWTLASEKEVRQARAAQTTHGHAQHGQTTRPRIAPSPSAAPPGELELEASRPRPPFSNVIQ